MTGRKLVWILLAVVALGLIAAAFVFDAPVRESILASQGPDWKETDNHRFISSVSRYGDWPQLMVVGGVGLVVAWKLRRRDWVQAVAAAMIASTLAGVLVNCSRLTTGRTRPRESPKIEQGWYGPWHREEGKLLIGDSAYNAFPSGHTATAMGFAVPLVLAKPVLGVPVLVGAGLIAWSRMALGAHHLSDVVAACMIAFFSGWFCLWFVRRRGDGVWAWSKDKIAKVRRSKT